MINKITKAELLSAIETLSKISSIIALDMGQKMDRTTNNPIVTEHMMNDIRIVTIVDSVKNLLDITKNMYFVENRKELDNDYDMAKFNKILIRYTQIFAKNYHEKLEQS